MSSTPEIEALMQLLLAKLQSLPDNTEISTSELLEELGICCDGAYQELFDLDQSFHDAVVRAGYIVDQTKIVGMDLGLPYNIPCIFRNKKNLQARFAQEEEKEVREDRQHYFVREFEECRMYDDDEEDPYEETQYLQLLRIPKGDVAWLSGEDKRYFLFTLRGKGTYAVYSEDLVLRYEEKLRPRKETFHWDGSCCIENTGEQDLVVYVGVME